MIDDACLAPNVPAARAVASKLGVVFARTVTEIEAAEAVDAVDAVDAAEVCGRSLQTLVALDCLPPDV